MSTEFERINVISVVSEESSLNYKWFDGGWAVKADKNILVISEDENFSEFPICVPRDVKAGDVLIRNPYKYEKPTYVRACDANKFIWEDECHILGNILTLVGVSSCEMKKTELQVDEYSFDAKGQGKKKVKIAADVEARLKKEAEACTCLKMSFKNNREVTQEDWEKAKDIATKTGLIENQKFCSLIDMRQPGKTCNIQHYEFSCVLSTKLNASLESAIKLNIPMVFKMDAEMKASVSRRYSLQVSYDITFD